MKYTFCFFLFLFLSDAVFAQRRQAEPLFYSNVARNQYNAPISNRPIAIQVSILKGSSTGAEVYREKHIVTTSFFGEFNIRLGDGEMKNGRFENINWTNGSFYLGLAIDTLGGTNFVHVGTPQLLHAPDNLYDKATGEVKEGIVRKGFSHYVGEQFGGGIIFSLWKDPFDKEHGLIVALNDQSDSMIWSNIDTMAIGVACQAGENGVKNTGEIIGQQGHKSSAALVCHNFNGGGFYDWYLPSTLELDLLFSNRERITNTLDKAGKSMRPYSYWSSTEYSAGSGWTFALYGGLTNNQIFGKYLPLHVRAIRAF